jgi:capsular polysaccharide biosynthesis protein
VTDRETAVTPFLDESAGLADRLGSYDERPPGDRDWDADPSAGLISLEYLKAAIRRSAFFCFVMTIVGLVIGGGLYVAVPAPYQAQATILITDGPYETGQGSASDDQAIGQSPTVALLAMRAMGLHGNVNGFLKQYLITVNSPSVLVVTFSAKTAAAAVSGANAVAVELLQFRQQRMEQQQGQQLAGLQQQLTGAQQSVTALTTQKNLESVKPPSPAQQSRLDSLKAELKTANGTVTSLQQSINTFDAQVPPATRAAVKGSNLPAPAALLPRAHLKRILLFPVAGLIGGLAVGIAIVLIRAIMSDRLRRRDDIANALGVSVSLSTGPLRRKRWLSLSGLRPGSAAARRANVKRIAAHLGRAVQERERGVDVLAVVVVDDPVAAALPLVSLAMSSARQGKRVVVADLASGAPAARLLGSARPGVRTVNDYETPLVVAVPDRDSVLPPGPLGRVAAWDPDSSFSQEVASACARADLLLTLVTVDPAFGADHLRTWAGGAVAVVTAGRSTWTRINAVGELVRLSGTRLVSAVLVGADRRDESLGEIPEPTVGPDAGIVAGPARPDGKSLIVAPEDSARAYPPPRPRPSVSAKESSSEWQHKPASLTRPISDDTVELPLAAPAGGEHRKHRPTPSK